MVSACVNSVFAGKSLTSESLVNLGQIIRKKKMTVLIIRSILFVGIQNIQGNICQEVWAH